MEPRRSARISAQAAATTAAAAKAPMAEIRKAKKTYARKEQRVVAEMNQKMDQFSAEAQLFIAQLSEKAKQSEAQLMEQAKQNEALLLEQVRQNEAEAQAFRALMKAGIPNGRGDDESDLEDVSMDESDGEEDEGLFVSREKTSLLVATDDNDDDDDEATLVTWNDILDYDTKDTKYYGYLSRGFNRTYDVIGRGPRNAEKLELVPSHRTVEKDDPDNLTAQREIKAEKRPKNGKTRMDIQGIAWVTSQCPEDPICLMDPRHWQKKRSEGNRANFPFTIIKVKWVTTDDEGKTTVQRTFETLTTVRKKYGSQSRSAPRDYMIGDRLVLPRGEQMKAGDLAIFAAAIISWDRHEKWKINPTTRKNRSPTPDEVLQTTESTRTRGGRKRAARQ
ncbi:hypothetical protein CSUB01_12140 [Colletotrichum sublineola]|uniref:Uncharacterized protein n=1 Tax=Colletotrichum sublineola TaxID=1173701 RepID=A0A066XDQ0_COLSU|nr:hypothetical protein CSUB01_12140 [Colletotrichum sublineola]